MYQIGAVTELEENYYKYTPKIIKDQVVKIGPQLRT
jgi:hypothetical protein